MSLATEARVDEAVGHVVADIAMYLAVAEVSMTSNETNHCVL